MLLGILDCNSPEERKMREYSVSILTCNRFTIPLCKINFLLYSSQKHAAAFLAAVNLLIIVYNVLAAKRIKMITPTPLIGLIVELFLQISKGIPFLFISDYCILPLPNYCTLSLTSCCIFANIRWASLCHFGAIWTVQRKFAATVHQLHVCHD